MIERERAKFFQNSIAILKKVGEELDKIGRSEPIDEKFNMLSDWCCKDRS
jgi:hypothetical protein